MIFRKLHSFNICFTVNSWSPSHWSHNGGWGLFSILNECVKRVWPIQRRLIITSSYLFVHPEYYFSSIWGMMACNLLPTSLSHRSCHKDEINGWIIIKKRLYMVVQNSQVVLLIKHLLLHDQPLVFQTMSTLSPGPGKTCIKDPNITKICPEVVEWGPSLWILSVGVHLWRNLRFCKILTG